VASNKSIVGKNKIARAIKQVLFRYVMSYTHKTHMKALYISSVKMLKLKGAICNIFEYLFTEMQNDIHNYIFSSD